MQKRVLLVDDESSLRRSLFLSLSQEGYIIEPCENGVNALKKLQSYNENDTKFDTIVLDIKLPDIDGIKLGKIFRSKCPDTKIIFITGYSDNLNRQELQNISFSTVLEKPFSTKDLTYQIEEILNDRAVTMTQPMMPVIPKEDKKEVSTFSAYAMVKIQEGANFLDIYRKLYFDNNVLYCDATNGDFDIFVLLQSHSIDGCKEICEKNIKSIDGVKEVEFCEVINPILDDNIRNIISSVDKLLSNGNETFQNRGSNNAVTAYLLLEVTKEKLDSVYPALYFNDNVVHCDYTNNGKYNLVLLVHGTQFSEIDNLIKNQISNMDGVLKVKKYPILTIFEM
jgi:CheY-like chemotaxis protein